MCTGAQLGAAMVLWAPTCPQGTRPPPPTAPCAPRAPCLSCKSTERGGMVLHGMAERYYLTAASNDTHLAKAMHRVQTHRWSVTQVRALSP
jgi:hypothetical protein